MHLSTTGIFLCLTSSHFGDDDDGDGDAFRGTADVGCDDELEVDAFRFGIGGGGDAVEVPSEDEGVEAADDEDAILLELIFRPQKMKFLRLSE